MKKIIFILSVTITNIGMAQNEWNTINNSTSAMFRNGNVAIGTGAVSTIPFAVKNSTAGTGTKIAFGNATTIGSYGVADGVLELYGATTSASYFMGLNTNPSANRSNLTFGISTFGAQIISGRNGTGTAYPLMFLTDGGPGATERMRITNTGNVGISATNPIGQFQVNSGIGKVAMGEFSSGAPYYMYNYYGLNAARNAGIFTFDGDGANNGGSIISSDAAGNLNFITIPTSGGASQTKTDAQVAASRKMVVRSDGKVGIGEPPSYPGTYNLYVTNGILTEKVKVAVKTSANWSDYVFASDYKLKSIDEVDTFIKKNKHLPNIPSADEVVKEGIDMATMDAKLLEKIEELTLYIIQLEKRIKQVENK
jgi:hypothetical protein